MKHEQFNCGHLAKNTIVRPAILGLYGPTCQCVSRVKTDATAACTNKATAESLS